MEAWIVMMPLAQADAGVIGVYSSMDSAKSGLWTYCVENDADPNELFLIECWEGNQSLKQLYINTVEVLERGK